MGTGTSQPADFTQKMHTYSEPVPIFEAFFVERYLNER
jgi:hypothetical protein